MLQAESLLLLPYRQQALEELASEALLSLEFAESMVT